MRIQSNPIQSGIADSSYGKWSTEVSDFAVMELKPFLPFLFSSSVLPASSSSAAKSIPPQADPYLFTLSPYASSILQSARSYDFATRVAYNRPSPRLDLYIYEDYDTVLKTLVTFSTKLLYFIGFQQVSHFSAFFCM